MEINEYIVEQMVDPTGIIRGDRYEYRLYITVDEEDELYAEGGTGLRVIFSVEDDQEWIATYHFFERSTEKPLDFEMEDDEKEIVLAFCQTHREG